MTKETTARAPVTQMLAVAGPPKWLGLPVTRLMIFSVGIIATRFSVRMKKNIVQRNPMYWSVCEPSMGRAICSRRKTQTDSTRFCRPRGTSLGERTARGMPTRRITAATTTMTA